MRRSLERWLSLEGALSEEPRRKLPGVLRGNRENGDTSLICIIAMIFQKFTGDLAKFPRKT